MPIQEWHGSDKDPCNGSAIYRSSEDNFDGSSAGVDEFRGITAVVGDCVL